MKINSVYFLKFLLFISFKSFAQDADAFDTNHVISIAPKNHQEVAYHLQQFSRTTKSLIIPIAFTTYGFMAIESHPLRQINSEFREEILEHHPQFGTKIDNYLQFSPSLLAFSMKLAGNKGEHDLLQTFKLHAASTILMAGTVYLLKTNTHLLRPDASARNSFPSGHTATAFVGAEILHQEFKHSAPLLSYTGYLAAGATGALRMYNNRHYFSDVITGAGIGILTTKATYWLDKKLHTKHH